MKNKRINMVCLIAGTRNTGKTTFVREKLMHRHPKKVLVVDTFDNPVWSDVPELDASLLPRWNRGTYRYWSSDTAEVMANIERHIYNALLVFEDATKYVGAKLTEDVRKFVLDSKQKNLDIVFIFHSLTDIPRDLVRISDTLTLFKTGEQAGNSLLRTKYPEKVIRAMPVIQDSSNRHIHKTLNIGA
ncbi:MAG: hypothetical protein RLP14_05905 [Owenweeksia sp.]